ncbi:MAG: M48 family metalloprotease [bacterium]|nr:M48 family metalloprotease [bacterium]
MLLLAAGLAFSAGCSVNPATGQRQVMLIGEQGEIAMGREADPQIQAQMGVYPDDEWQEYIQALGSDLAARSERPELPWTFRVIDDPIVNAFALPGGFIYVTRGILTHFNSEAELASVLGHEIGHVTGRHGAERASKAQLAGIGMAVGSVLSPEFAQYGDVVGQGIGLLFLKFGRADEREADDLGLRYMTRGEYVPDEMPKVFRTLERVSAAQGAGRIPAWLSTHPDPGNRAARISQQIAELPPDPNRTRVNRDSYLQRLENMPFGKNPREGYTIGSSFYHPDMAFQLDFPEGWKIANQRQAVTAISPEQDAIVVLALAAEDSPEEAHRAFFAQQGVERGDDWRRGFNYFRTPLNEQQRRIVGLAGHFSYGDSVLRLMSYTRDDKWSPYGKAMERSVASFRRLTDRRYLDVQPARVEIVRLDRSMTLEEFQRRYPSTVELSELAIVNGVAEDARLEAGRRMKRVVGGELPDS